MPPWLAGLQLGPYILVSPVGPGGMGEVWKARDTRLDRIVAIKRLKTLAVLLIRTGEEVRGKEPIQRLVCGEIDLAADWIEKAIEERHPVVAYYLQGPAWEPLRFSPRWPKLAALMHLPDAE